MTFSMKPLVLGFIQVRGELDLPATADTAQLSQWSHREGYLLGVIYREQDGNGAFDTLISAMIEHDAAGVVVPSLDHFGPDPETRTGTVRRLTGKQVFVVLPSAERVLG